MHAREIMTRTVVTVQPSTSVAQAAQILTHRGFTAMPVVDDHGDLVGIVTEADLIANRYVAPAPDGQASTAPARTVGQVMTTPVIGVSHDADVAIIARLMITEGRRSLPIVDGNRLVGVVTRRDILRVLSRSDSEVADEVRKHLRVLGGATRWSVQVVDGEVIVRDAYEDASDRHVAQVLAEAVPGVIRATVAGRNDRQPDPVPAGTEEG